MAIYDLKFTRAEYNLLKLDADLRAAFAGDMAGVTAQGADITVHLLREPTAAEQDQIAAALAAHDPTSKTPAQLEAEHVAAVAAAADTNAANIPGWAHWTEKQTVDYITANVTDLASARTVLIAMARMMVALRNKNWPRLQE